MGEKRLGIIMNGVTGRMGTNQHLVRSILAIRAQGGTVLADGTRIMPDPILVYRKAAGGGIILDMLCHWRYVLDGLFGAVESVSCLGANFITERWDESGKPYRADSDDAAFATFQIAGGIVAQINASWATRVRGDDLVTFQVDGTQGSAVARATRRRTPKRGETPRPVWNPDERRNTDFLAQWREVPDDQVYDNGFKVQWEMFIRHLHEDAPFRWDLLARARGVQLAELGMQSWEERRWIDVPALEG